MRAIARRREAIHDISRRLQVGGTLHPEKHIYIQRPEDDEVLRLLLAGDYVNVLTSRQMGKSSLMARTCYALKDRNIAYVSIDLAGELGSPEDPELYYRGFLQKIARDLNLAIDIKAWWQAHEVETSNQKLLRFFREEVADVIDVPLVIFLDEIDSTLKLPFTDDLFTALRTMNNGRAFEQAYRQITFCLLGVATPNELIKDRRTTAYNVGRTLELRDFDAKRDDLTPLALTLSPHFRIGHALLDRVLHWTGGHPYLTNRLCQDLAEAGVQQVNGVDQHVEATFRTLDKVNNDVHVQQILRFVEKRFTRDLETLDLFTNVLKGERERDQNSLPHAELKLSGLVKRDDQGCLIVRNKIYTRLFDKKWVSSTRPKRTLERWRLYAMAASFALAVAVSSGWYYLATIDQSLTTREKLEDLEIAIFQPSATSGITIEFPAFIEQVELENAAPILQELSNDITAVKLADARIIDLRPLAALPSLRSIDLSRALVRNFESLAGLTNLHALNLSSTRFNNLRPLLKINGLQNLDVSNTEISDLTSLSNLNALYRLNLAGTNIIDLAPLAGLTNLDWLKIANTNISDLHPLSNLKQLDFLDISGTQVSDISPLSDLGDLDKLYLPNTRVSDLNPLLRLTSLQTIIAYNTEIADLNPLSELTGLEKLSFYNTPVANIKPLSRMTSLRSIDLGKTNVSDLSPLLKLPILESLILTNTPIRPPEFAMFKLELESKTIASPFIRGPNH